MLAAAALACIGSAPSSAPTQSASFATVTPGGRVSVSLLDSTQPAPNPLAQGATPIGPVATGTAAAATAIAQTMGAPTITPTIPGLLAPPAECPAPGSPSLPAEPPTFSQFDEVIAQYLSGGGAATIIEGRLAAWGAFTSYGGLVRADRDFTGDGVPEVLAVLMDPSEQEFPYPGDLYIFGCEGGAYRLLYQAGHASNRSAPLILNYNNSDINANQLNDLVYAVQTCDERTCETSVEVVEWNLTLGNFDTLLTREVNELFASAEVTDIEGDGIGEIVVTSGAVASEAAGPQRSTVTTLRWDGASYAVAEQETAGTEYRIHVIQEADEAFEAGDMQTAIAAYQRAIDEADLQSWTYPDEAAHLRAYSRFRQILAHVVQGNTAGAQAAYDALMSTYGRQPAAAPPGEGDTPGEGAEAQPPTATPTSAPLSSLNQPGSGFAEMARLFWLDYTVSRDAAHACQLVTSYARTSPASYEVLNSFGYSSPTVTANDLCPLGG